MAVAYHLSIVAPLQEEARVIGYIGPSRARACEGERRLAHAGITAEQDAVAIQLYAGRMDRYRVPIRNMEERDCVEKVMPKITAVRYSGLGEPRKGEALGQISCKEIASAGHTHQKILLSPGERSRRALRRPVVRHTDLYA